MSTVQSRGVQTTCEQLNDSSSLSNQYHSLSPTLQFLIGNVSSSSSFSCVSLYVCFFVDLFPWQIYQDPAKQKTIIYYHSFEKYQSYRKEGMLHRSLGSKIYGKFRHFLRFLETQGIIFHVLVYIIL